MFIFLPDNYTKPCSKHVLDLSARILRNSDWPHLSRCMWRYGIVVVPSEVAVRYFQIVTAFNIVALPKFGPS